MRAAHFCRLIRLGERGWRRVRRLFLSTRRVWRRGKKWLMGPSGRFLGGRGVRVGRLQCDCGRWIVMHVVCEASMKGAIVRQASLELLSGPTDTPNHLVINLLTCFSSKRAMNTKTKSPYDMRDPQQKRRCIRAMLLMFLL